MQIGKQIRKFIVEPLESPVPVTAPDPEPGEREPVAPTRKPQTELVQDPVTP